MAESTGNRNLECPLCYDIFSFAVTTSCGHTFCDVWENKGRNIKLLCPIDRREVSMLIPNFVVRTEVEKTGQDSILQNSMNQSLVMDKKIDEYNQLYAHQPRNIVVQSHEDWILLQRMFKESYLYKFLIAITIISFFLYLYVPYDLIPDGKLPQSIKKIDIGWIGYIDDFCVMLTGFWIIYLLVEWYRWKLLREIRIAQERNV